jgi:hypothetical protein
MTSVLRHHFRDFGAILKSTECGSFALLARSLPSAASVGVIVDLDGMTAEPYGDRGRNCGEWRFSPVPMLDENRP